MRHATPLVLLDRDGTLVKDAGFTHRVEDYALLPGVADALLSLGDAGFSLAIVTNQSGIGRGLFSEADYEGFQRHLVRDLARQGVTLAGSFHCPHVSEDGCSCRKPQPGLLLRAAEVLNADLSRSWLVGDALRDAQAASRAGCRGAVLLGTTASGRLPAGTLRAADLTGAARAILEAQRTP